MASTRAANALMTPRHLRRLRGMTGTEARWRAMAAARTLAERVSYAFGTGWHRDSLGDAPARIAARLRSGDHRFLLDPASVNVMRATILAQWPSAADVAAARADRILAGSFDLLGYHDLHFRGADGAIDWHVDPVHNRRAPLRFWNDIPYLDPSVGDHKIIWELNRHQHWLVLGRALWLTGDTRYALAISQQLDGWMAANPPLMGINWASMLELGLRSISWLWALHFLAVPDVDDAAHGSSRTLQNLLVGLDRQARHIEAHLSHYFSPNTHLTGEALALYAIGTALPELAGSTRWAATGRRILLDEIDRQVLPDGGHVERSTHYQRYTLDFYLTGLLIARGAGDAEAAGRFEAVASRLAEFTRAIADNNGRLPLIGDDDGGTLWRFTDRSCSDVRDSLAVAAAALERPDLAPWGTTEEALWLAGPKIIADRDRDKHRSLPLQDHRQRSAVASCALKDTGYIVMRNERGDHLVFDAGAHGYMNGGHAHADALSVTLTLEQGPLLIDPGTATYTMNGALRDRMRGSASHNTLTIDGRGQSEPAGPFHWRTRADATLGPFLAEPAFDLAEGWHDAYAPIRHRRRVIRMRNEGWLIVDELLGTGTHDVTAHWHFDPRWMAASDAPGRLRLTHETGYTVRLVHEGETAVLTHGDDGDEGSWCAPAYGALVPAWTARITTRAVLPRTLVTWIDTAGVGLIAADRLIAQEALWAS
jgi:hypothetical protein